MNWIVFFLVFVFILILESYKILICNPKIGYSHVNFFGQIADILHEAGHDVTVLSVDMDLSIKHPGAYKAKIINYPSSPSVSEMFSKHSIIDSLWESDDNTLSQFITLNLWADAIYEQGLMIFNDNNLTLNMKNEKFDFAIVEPLNHYFIGLFKVWGIKNYALGSAITLIDTLYDEFGLQFPASFMPTAMNYFGNNITFIDRFGNLISHWITLFYTINKWSKPTLYEEFNKKYGKNFFDIRKSISDTSFFFINSNPFLNFPGPKVPKMVEIAGIGLPKPKLLNNYWNNILSKRNYTILISFGTISKCHNMPKKMKNVIINTIKNMKHITFIWKYEKLDDNIDSGIDNLIVTEWFPQNNLLNDKRISLFITHGGANSITELAFNGVKAIVIPIFVDQYKNAKLIEKHNIGKLMKKNYLKVDGLLEKYINDVINNKKYSNNALLLSERLKNLPIQPKRLLINYVNFACKYGPFPMLDLPSINMGFIEYHNILQSTNGTAYIALTLIKIDNISTNWKEFQDQNRTIDIFDL
ncbi:UDP-glucuronosyl/UDP-glucosyltransferase family-containing protein [Strongyloides ratti]|uniref:glucuronosyltransferase n=1 Tax=Strongyloides ratti TaxID=34506 RepID=A0A090N037_STRRB|nr:UDP-glucuronosyl/UDP-glucosyltransferase family-containing protein [Strongyloides ratti]CEF70005.1 UDP-glucuronosyl/UDP-glucosyltransferase family-containing protein [Strongyloides ratti]